MTTLIRIFADFNNADIEGRIRLNTEGTLIDIRKNNIVLVPGLEILLDDQEELQTKGIVEFSEKENIWVAKINWDEFKTY